MSLDKGIKHGKERRKQFRGVKAYCKMCRNHGGCDYCQDNRLHSDKKRLERLKDLSEELHITDKQNNV